MGFKGWEDTEKAATRSGGNGGGQYLKIEDGDSIVMAFCGEPYAKEIVWIEGRSEEYNPMEHGGEKKKLRVSLNCYVPDDGEMLIWEFSPTVFKQILAMRDKYGLDKRLYEVSREGVKLNTTYRILPDAEIDTALAKEIAQAKLHDLDPMSFGEDDDDFDANDPIPDDIREGLIARFKRLPRPTADAVLDQAGVSRVRDLKRSQLPIVEKALSLAEKDISQSDRYA